MFHQIQILNKFKTGREKNLQSYFGRSLVKNIKIAYGGMSNVPKRAIYCEKIIINSRMTAEIIHKAKGALEKDFEPITDVRASSQYRMEVAKNLLEKCFLEIKQKKLIRINN